MKKSYSVLIPENMMNLRKLQTNLPKLKTLKMLETFWTYYFGNKSLSFDYKNLSLSQCA